MKRGKGLTPWFRDSLGKVVLAGMDGAHPRDWTYEGWASSAGGPFTARVTTSDGRTATGWGVDASLALEQALRQLLPEAA